MPEHELSRTNEDLRSIFSIETAPRGNFEYPAGTVIIIPSFGDVQRVDHIALTLVILGRQATEFQSRQYDHPVKLVVADNGMSDDFGSFVQGCAEYHGLDVRIINARPQNDRERSPAFARNKALDRIRNDASFRSGDTLLFLDDDSALGPNALNELDATLRSSPHKPVAVFGDVRTVPTLNQAVYDAEDWSADGKVHVLPRLFNEDGTFDLTAMVAFSSLVAGKLNGILIDRHILQQFPSGPHIPFVSMPHKSAEDMTFMAALGNQGKILQNNAVKVLDPGRPTTEQTLRQQKAWGHDHVILAQHLSQLGLLPKGLRVLEPTEQNGWQEWEVPGTRHMAGCVVNPTELQTYLPQADGTDGIDPKGMAIAKEVLQLVEAGRATASNIQTRPNLPMSIAGNCIRSLPEARLGRLTGNLEGIAGVNNGRVETVVLGTRQQGVWV